MVNTVESDIYNALLTRVASLVTSPDTDIAYPGINFKPGDKTYLDIRVFPQDALTHLLGSSDPKVYRGTLQITVVSNPGAGIIKDTEIASQIVEHFKMGTRMDGDAVVDINEQPSVSATFIDNAKQHTPVRIRYFSSN